MTACATCGGSGVVLIPFTVGGKPFKPQPVPCQACVDNEIGRLEVSIHRAILKETGDHIQAHHARIAARTAVEKRAKPAGEGADVALKRIIAAPAEFEKKCGEYFFDEERRIQQGLEMAAEIARAAIGARGST
jgi:hypothetical protein